MTEKIRFTKMHGCGNDYIYVNMMDNAIAHPQAVSVALSNRHKGIGSDGLVLIDKSSVPEADFSMRIFNADGSEEIKAGGMFGEDIASAKAFLVQDKLTSEALTAILSGETEGYDMELAEIEDDDYTFGGSTFIPMAADAPTGTYTIVVIGYDADGEAQEYDYTEFKYQNPNDSAPTFSPWAIGDFTYTVFFTETDDNGEEIPYVDEDLTILRGDSNPNRFKVEHWGYDVDFFFEFQEDGSILVDDQPTGYVHSSYGMVNVRDFVTASGSTEQGQSSYDAETGTFKFLVNYYVSAGSFGSGVETLEVKSAAVNARLAEAQRNAMAKGAKPVTKKSVKMDRTNVNPLNYTPVLYR